MSMGVPKVSIIGFDVIDCVNGAEGFDGVQGFDGVEGFEGFNG